MLLQALITLTVTWLACAVPVHVLAQEEPETHGEATGEARVHFSRGVEHYSEGNYDAALVEFERAQQLSPNYKLLYNLAQVQMERHDYAAALKLLTDYLAQGGSEIADDRVEAVAQDLQQLRQRIAKLIVRVNVRGAEIFVNDVSVGVAPLSEPLLVNVGRCRIRVEKAGYAPRSQDLSVAGKDERNLTFVLEPPSEAALHELARSSAATAAHQGERNLTPFWLSASATLVLGAATATFGVLSVSAQQHNAATLAIYPGRVSELDAAHSRLQTFAVLTDGFAAGTLVVGAVALYFFISPPERSHATPADRATLRLVPTGTGAALHATF